MKLKRLHVPLAASTVLLAAVLAQALIPRVTMARDSDSLNLERIIPRQLEGWASVPDVRIVEPPGSDTLSREIYNQEIARGYMDHDGHVVMLLVAYGASQSDRLQLHRPEICYAAQGFRVSSPTRGASPDAAPLRLTRLVAQREDRFEPVTYWMRIGDDIATGVVERQILKVKYGLRGLIPDGALIRISTTGLPEALAFEVETQFIRDLLAGVDPATRGFLLGETSPTRASSLPAQATEQPRG